MKKKSSVFLVIFVLILLLLAFGLLGSAFLIRKPLLSIFSTSLGGRTIPNLMRTADTSDNGGSGKNSAGIGGTGGSNKIDKQLLGSWDTGCLVPSSNSDYSERHTFTFYSDGTSNHKRYIGGSLCNNQTLRNDEQLTWEIVGAGKINFVYSTGGRIYDIYEATPTTLKFGHGFCNCTYLGGHFGASEADRFVMLNEFLLYKKQ